MFDKIVGRIKSIFGSVPVHAAATYKEAFELAVAFTNSKGFVLDSDKGDVQYHALVEELAGALSEQNAQYKARGLDPLVAFGGDCGNVHVQVLKYIQKYYPYTDANLVMGEVSIGQDGFSFDQATFLKWQETGAPEILDCHVWIAIGSDYIVDCTLGTYINTRIVKSSSSKACGGVICGSPNDLKIIKINGLAHIDPIGFNKVIYRPVAIGLSALEAIGPRS
jgi:hypothetical protein